MDKRDKLPWLLLPCIVLTLSSAALLVPRHPAQAAPPAVAVGPKPILKAYDDGDGDELLEHWGDPKYAREERLQMAGLTGGFLLLLGVTWRTRTLKDARPHLILTEPEETVEVRKAA